MALLRKGRSLRFKGIRPCRLDDLDVIMNIEESSFKDPYSYETFLSFLVDEKEGFVVAEDSNGDLVGYCVFSKRGSRGCIVSIAVKERYLRRKWGSILLSYAIQELSKQTSIIELQVAVGNHRAISFYKRFGFLPVKVIADYYPNGEDALFMELTSQHG